MEPLPFTLVIISIFSHAYWNYLIKSSTNKHVFTGLTKLAEIVLFAMPAVYFLVTFQFRMEFLLLVVVAAGITFLNYFFLSSAYKYGDLSLVYPVSRSSVIFLPGIAYLFTGETIDATGALAIALILLGTIVMHLDSIDMSGLRTLRNNLSNKGSVYAIIAALAVAGYTLWDKVSISKMEPFLYFYLYTFLVGILYNGMTLSRFSREDFRNEWKMNRARIIQVGFLNGFTYILILIALTTSKATYVGGLRQLSIVIGAVFGYKLLGERLGVPKLIGISISIAGAFLIYLAR